MPSRYDIARQHGLECGEMLGQKEALQLPPGAAIDRQIELREEMIGQMVGWLYPSIIQDEIQALKRVNENILKETDNEVS